MIDVEFTDDGVLVIDSGTGKWAVISLYNVYKFLKHHPKIARQLLEEELKAREEEIDKWIEETLGNPPCFLKREVSKLEETLENVIKEVEER